MTYYKVKARFDGTPRYLLKNGCKLYDSSFIGNELYTPKERARYAINDSLFEVVTVPKNRVYRSFGARYEIPR